MNRRQLLWGLCATVAGFNLKGVSSDSATAGLSSGRFAQDLADLEKKIGGRLGVAFLDTGSGTRVDHRSDERFPLCSTFKLLAVGAVLSRVDAGKESLDRAIRYSASDLVAYSPVTKAYAGDERGLSIAGLCEAAMTRSDNTAGNLLLASLDGPSNLNVFLRSLGDSVTRLDRIEPELNEALPGDPRDTTTPAAMLSDLRLLALGTVLSKASRELLTGWLIHNQTGNARLRAGLPADWRIGDKTGSGERGSTNDVGLIWPPQRPPVLVSVYLTGTLASSDQCNATLAAVGRAIASAMP